VIVLLRTVGQARVRQLQDEPDLIAVDIWQQSGGPDSDHRVRG
jgi:hypothetical protein